MKIALLQLEVLEKNKEANVAHGLQLAAEAAKKHDLLVLPEVWTTGYSLGHLEQEAETPASPVLAQLAEIARNEQCAVLAGSVPMRHADGKIYNTSAAINKNGEIVNIGNFIDYDVAEIIEILLDIFAGDNKHIFNVNLEEYGIQSFLELLKYVTERDYPTAVNGLKESLQNGELDVSFS